jgi:transcriptional regulator with XRE-family HTH domain
MNSIQSNENMSVIFGRHVRNYRHEAGLTQADASARCGIYQNYLSRIESGKANPTINIMAALAETLHIELYKLLM